QKTWPVHRSVLHLAGAEGACLPDLNVLPELAPCYVATDDALIVGWNPTSLQRALARVSRSSQGREADAQRGEAERSAGPREEWQASEVHQGGQDAPARIDLDLALIQRADDLLARAFPDSQPPLRWPWSRVVASGGQSGGAVALHVTFAPL